ncbi:MAG: HAMP domain-containing histidine kinase [Rhizobacter sp.]|nr:HAMP domain-containing histidine kinase [Bacteriovorax sp.]
MNIEENLIVRSSQNDKNKNLKKELDAAKAVIKTYERIIEELKLENSNNLKHFTHDLANPLQILSMTIESLQDNPPKDITAALERMKRSADNMTTIILQIRKLRNISSSSSSATTTVSGLKVV